MTPLRITAGAAIDADGDPGAYNPNGGGDDALGNAGHEGDWYGVVTDNGKRTGRPLKQGPYDPCPGNYIPTTALVDPTMAVTDPRRYVDSRIVRYISIPGDVLHSPIEVGDVALVEWSGRQVSAIVADVGPRGKWGEVSIATAKALGFKNCSPRNGGVDSGVTYTIWPGSRRPVHWPRTNEDVATQVAELSAVGLVC